MSTIRYITEDELFMELLRNTGADAVYDDAMVALDQIVTAIDENPGTGQVGRLVAFIAGCYNGPRYPFDLTELRGLDARLADACLTYLQYERFGLKEIHKHIEGGGLRVQQWIEEYGIGQS